MFIKQSNLVNCNHQQKKYSKLTRLIDQLQSQRLHLIVAGLALAPCIAFSQTWVRDSQYTNQPALATVQASGAYLQGITGQGVRIGIIDTGINPNNLAFSGALFGGYNSLTGLTGTSNLADLKPTLPVGNPNGYHGSLVSSIIVAQRGNGGYFQGIAYGAKLVVGAVDINGGFTDAQMANTLTYLTSQGVKVINNSWGAATNNPITLGDIYPLTSIALQQAASSAVMVFASGNDRASNPFLPATLPDFVPEMQGSWIVVAATSINGQNFAPYSNFCGSTMSYCLLAPGGITRPIPEYDGGITGINGASNSNTIAGVTYAQGTSEATPLVSGAVALVAEVFPWMGPSQLTTTILTTASNAATPDAMIGRGMLRIDAAIQGPAILETTFNANTGGYSSTFSNNISGLADLIKSGEGTLTLTGANTYRGGTTVSGGTLRGNSTSLQGNILNNSAVVFDQPSTGTYAGLMSGTGSLIKQNAGILILTGANTYTGGTTVASGTLSVSGTSSTGFGNVSVSSGATLMGTGTINGQLTVAGILKPGNSPGYLSTTSTVTMSSGSSYLQDIAGKVQASRTSPVGASGYYSFLNVTNGQFVILPGSTLAPQLSNLFTIGQVGFGSAIYLPGLGDRLRIVTADGGVRGKFSTVTQPAELAAGTQFIPFYNMAGSNSIDLAVIPTSYQTTIAAASGNANAHSVGGALTQLAQASLAGTATAAQDQFLYALSGQTSAQSITNLAQGMSGEVYAATVAVIAQTTQRTQQAVLNRLGDMAGLGLNMPMPSVNMSTQVGGAPSASVSSNPSVNPKADAQSFSKGNVWGELAYQRGNRSSDSQSGGWNSNLYQLTFGTDFYSSNGTTAGAGLALSSTTLNPAYGSSTIQQGSLFAYGKMPAESFVLDAMASVGLNSSDIKRGDVTGLSTGFRNNSVSGNDVMVSLGLSRPFDAESMRITPFARVTWQMVSQSGVNEGDVASALSVNRYTGNGVRGVIGVAVGSMANNPMTAKNTFRAYVGVGADTSGLLNPTLNASLAGIGTNVTTPNAGTAFVQAGLYGTAKMSENTFAYAGISGEARSGQTLGTVNVGLKLQF